MEAGLCGSQCDGRRAGKGLKIQAWLYKKHIKHLETDIRRKEKALAETEALLVIRKKAHAIWGESEEE